jgi:hypothetical protein
VVHKSAEEVTGESRPGGLRWHHGLIATGLTVALAVAVLALAPRAARAPAEETGTTATPTATVAPVPPVTDPEPPRSQRLDDLLATTPRDQAFSGAIRAVEERWGETALARTTLRTHDEQLRRLDLPVVLEMFHPSRRDTSYLALLRLDGTAATVAGADGEPFEVPRSQVDAFWTREAVFPWPEGRALPPDASRQAAWIRDTLAGLGYGGGNTTESVTRFQRDAGLVADGVPGPRTRLVLFALSPGSRPRLSDDEGSS